MSVYRPRLALTLVRGFQSSASFLSRGSRRGRDEGDKQASSSSHTPTTKERPSLTRSSSSSTQLPYAPLTSTAFDDKFEALEARVAEGMDRQKQQQQQQQQQQRRGSVAGAGSVSGEEGELDEEEQKQHQALMKALDSTVDNLYAAFTDQKTLAAMEENLKRKESDKEAEAQRQMYEDALFQAWKNSSSFPKSNDPASDMDTFRESLKELSKTDLRRSVPQDPVLDQIMQVIEEQLNKSKSVEELDREQDEVIAKSSLRPPHVEPKVWEQQTLEDLNVEEDETRPMKNRNPKQAPLEVVPFSLGKLKPIGGSQGKLEEERSVLENRVANRIQEALLTIIHKHNPNPVLMRNGFEILEVVSKKGTAFVYWVDTENDRKNSEIEAALESSKGQLRHLLSQKLRLKYVPHLSFVKSDRLRKEKELDDVFAKLRKENQL